MYLKRSFFLTRKFSSLTFKVALVLVVNSLFSATAFGGNVSSQNARAEFEADASERIQNAQAQYQRLYGKPKPDGYTHCRWNDPRETKQAMPFYLSRYEDAIMACKDQWAPHTQTVWRGLKRAKDSQDPDEYQIAIELLKSSRYLESAENSAVRALTDKVISLFEAGASKTDTMRESYFSCVKWAELDPDQIMSGRAYTPLSAAELAIAKGLLVCD